jgi:hypothetical protein
MVLRPALVSTRAAAASAALLAGCGAGGGHHDEWFPLEAGHRWSYAVRTVTDPDGEERLDNLELANRGFEEIFSQRAARRRSDSGNEYWLRADASGVYRMAARGPLDAGPIADEEKRYVVKAPLVVGTEWQAATISYLLARRNEVPKEVRVTHKAIPMTYRIAAVGEAVQVPAGKFADCLRVEGRAEVRLYVDEARKWSPVPLITREWYCRGVGLVRLERHEPVPSKFMVGGLLTMELQTWQ